MGTILGWEYLFFCKFLLFSIQLLNFQIFTICEIWYKTFTFSLLLKKITKIVPINNWYLKVHVYSQVYWCTFLLHVLVPLYSSLHVQYTTCTQCVCVICTHCDDDGGASASSLVEDILRLLFLAFSPSLFSLSSRFLFLHNSSASCDCISLSLFDSSCRLSLILRVEGGGSLLWGSAHIPLSYLSWSLTLLVGGGGE